MKRRQFIQAIAATAISSALLGRVEAQACPACLGPARFRRSFTQLTGSEWNAFVAAMNQTNIVIGALQPTLSDIFARDFESNYDSFMTYNPYFISGLARLRRFLVDFEGLLQRFSPSLCLPYWDFPADASSPAQSSIFLASYMGGNGVGLGRVVQDGAFQTWTNGYPGLLNIVPLRAGIHRRFDGGSTIKPWVPLADVDNIIAQTPTLDLLTEKLMSLVLRPVFNGIGGDLSTRLSPNDPIFWLAACYIDKRFSDWLQMHPEIPQPDPVCYVYELS
jgi:tyrosinase